MFSKISLLIVVAFMSISLPLIARGGHEAHTGREIGNDVPGRRDADRRDLRNLERDAALDNAAGVGGYDDQAPIYVGPDADTDAIYQQNKNK